jgi:hypothetical protein
VSMIPARQRRTWAVTFVKHVVMIVAGLALVAGGGAAAFTLYQVHEHGIAVPVDVRCPAADDDSAGSDCFADYSYAGVTYTGVPLTDTLFPSEGRHMARVLPGHPDRPHLGREAARLSAAVLGPLLGIIVVLLGGGGLVRASRGARVPRGSVAAP